MDYLGAVSILMGVVILAVREWMRYKKGTAITKEYYLCTFIAAVLILIGALLYFFY